MKPMIVLTPLFLALLITPSAWSESLHVKISGMHCGSCEKAVRGKICQPDKFAQCDAKIIDSKAQIGELIIETKPGQSLATDEILNDIRKLGYQPEISKSTEKTKAQK